jgi:hypothetical protein
MSISRKSCQSAPHDRDALAIASADTMLAHMSEFLPNDAACIMALIAVLGRASMIVHRGDIAKAQGLINGICESAKLETLNLAAGGRPS